MTNTMKTLLTKLVGTRTKGKGARTSQTQRCRVREHGASDGTPSAARDRSGRGLAGRLRAKKRTAVHECVAVECRSERRSSAFPRRSPRYTGRCPRMEPDGPLLALVCS